METRSKDEIHSPLYCAVDDALCSWQSQSENEEWKIPPPPSQNSSFYQRRMNPSVTLNSSTPLLASKASQVTRPLEKGQRDDYPTREGISRRSRCSEQNRFVPDSVSIDATINESFDVTGSERDERRPTGISGFFFGFMYEDPFQDSFENDDKSDLVKDDRADLDISSSQSSVCNHINMALFASYALTTAATTVPILLTPTIAVDFQYDDSSGFASRVAASAVLGTAFGKFLNGPISDVFGARRTSVLFSFLLSLSLLAMSACTSITSILWACFFVEFFQSVQWPCILIILATHYGPKQHFSQGKNYILYEGGIYLTSIASRFGSLLGIPFFSLFLNKSRWRWVCIIGAWVAIIGTSVTHLFVKDSRYRVNEPQNPLHPTLLIQISEMSLLSRDFLTLTSKILYTLFVDKLFPSMRHVLRSGTFWIVALAHTGSSMIRTSERILTTYFHDTSLGFLSQEKAQGLSIFASLGTILGLAICGTYFTSLSQERHRKRFVSRLYIMTIASCYALAVFALPRLYQKMDDPGLVLFFQIFASFCMNLGIAVMFYQIPGLVGSAYGNHKGLFSAYVDGVAYGMASFVWKIVASSVSENFDGAGWAYGWSAVALLLILCGILMVEFMEHYFVRPSLRHGTQMYETIILA